jgi:hypothetical protein
LGSSAGVFEVSMTPTATNTWQQFNFTANQFTGTLENLTDVNLIQLRFIGDNLGGGNADFYVDQMSIVPEPSSKVLILSFALALGGVFWKRFRPQTAR